MNRRAAIAFLFTVIVLSGPFAFGPVSAGPGADYAPGEVIIKFKDGASSDAVERIHSELGSDRVRGLGHTKAQLHRLGSLSVEDAVARYRHHLDVEYIEPNYIVEANRTPADPYFPFLWALWNTGQSGGTPGADMSAREAWDVFTGSPTILIGVIDSGIDIAHPDLAANIWTNPGEIPGNGIDDDNNGFIDDVHGWDFYNNDNDPVDDNGHGTHCAGTIGAVGDNGIGVTGINWSVSLVPLKFLGASGTGTTADAIMAIDYATELGVHLTSNSWGGGPFSQALLDAINAADAAGILFVASAGGGGSDTDITPFYPACYPSPNIVAVAGTDQNDVLGGYSGYGATTIDIAAPGSDILSTRPGNTYSTLSGTSMATAQVAGALGLMMGRFPGIGHLDAKERLLNTSDPLPSLVGRCLSGGRVNLFRAVTGLETVAAYADVEPNTLNLNGEGNWVTARVELPVEYDPAVVDVETVRLNGTVPADPDQSRIEDFNKNQIPYWTFKFARAAVEAILPEGNAVPVTITGEIVATALFSGTDVIRVTRPVGTASNDGETSNAGSNGALPAVHRLHQNTPNPFRGATRIGFELPQDGRVMIQVLDPVGRLIRTLADTSLPAGRHEVAWDGRDAGGITVATGVYFYRLRVPGYETTRRLVLLR